MGVRLTKKQTAVYEYIKAFIADNGYSPSLRDIQAGLGLSSVSAVAEHVDNLVSLGALRKSPKSARSLEVVDVSYPETTALFRTKFANASDSEKEILMRAALILGVDLEEPEEVA